MIVPRQDYQKDTMAAVVSVMEESLSESLEKIETSHSSRSDAVMESLNVALVRSVGDPGAVMLETWESWLLAMQVHSAVFAAADPDREAVTCKIRQEERRLATTGPQTYLNGIPIEVETDYLRGTARIRLGRRIRRVARREGPHHGARCGPWQITSPPSLRVRLIFLGTAAGRGTQGRRDQPWLPCDTPTLPRSLCWRRRSGWASSSP